MTGAVKPALTPGAVHACSDDACRRPCQGQGMSAQTEVDAYAKEMAALQADWGGLTPEQRLAKMQSIVGNQAKVAGFPQPQVVRGEDLGKGRNGELRFRDWQVAINPALLDAKVFDARQAAALGGTLFHEVRHAEQWFLMARRQAAEGLESRAIREQLNLPPRIADAASRVPLNGADTRLACADALHTSVYGRSSAHRGTTLKDLAELSVTVQSDAVANNQALAALAKARLGATADKTAFEALKARVPSADAVELQNSFLKAQYSAERLSLAQEACTAAYAKAKASYEAHQATYAAYRSLPEEADAWDAGGRASSAISAALAEPPSP